MATVVTYDGAPGFIADVLELNGQTVCVLSPDVFTDAETRSLVRTWMRGQGVDCEACLGCSVGVMQQGGNGGDPARP
ncbi:hypothetical protein ABZT17_12285 [Streptomyces sp. NPDC005648]|uniref:hypothetical protein n=1 Tax=Streptomyces sp. NPDC005648 TaxID=3157044 RepID=UPI0033B1257B